MRQEYCQYPMLPAFLEGNEGGAPHDRADRGPPFAKATGDRTGDKGHVSYCGGTGPRSST